MENATRALMMAASILITLLILGLLIFTFKKVKQTKDEDRDSILTEQVTQFNKRFTGYEKTIRGNELYSLINRMIDYNAMLEKNKGTSKQTSHDKMNIVIEINNGGQLFHFNNIFTNSRYELAFFEEARYNYVPNKGTLNLRQTVEAIEEVQEFGGQEKLRAIVSEFDTCANKTGTGFESPDMEKQFDKKLEDLGLSGNKDTIKSPAYLRMIRFYSEYIDFKRAKFEHITTKYESEARSDGTTNNATGRINYMEYKSK